MKVQSKRVQERSTLERIIQTIHDYAYLETLIIVTLYLVVGYIINPADACILNGEISYILILLAVITLFHGFENGILAVGIIALAMWYFYPSFQYVEFLVTLMMTMIFSEFHYYWTKKVQEAEINADYRGAKLDELSKAFYSLKISHDQLEKNYVVKPMSIRNSMEHIIDRYKEINEDEEIVDKNQKYYTDFLGMLEKSFNVHNALIVYKKDDGDKSLLSEKTANIVFGETTQKSNPNDIFKDYLVDKAITRQVAIYISDHDGDPTIDTDKNSKFIAAIPSVQEGSVVAVLIIEKMPFMAFNRENLTSISILLDYFSVEIRNKNILNFKDEVSILPDEDFRFEYARLKMLYNAYKVNSIVLVLRIDNELQAIRIYEKVKKMLRSLDMVTHVEENELYYITLMFPLHDEAAALGYLNRLMGSFDEEKDKNFNYMTFTLAQTQLLNKYLREDYGR